MRCKGKNAYIAYNFLICWCKSKSAYKKFTFLVVILGHICYSVLRTLNDAYPLSEQPLVNTSISIIVCMIFIVMFLTVKSNCIVQYKNSMVM